MKVPPEEVLYRPIHVTNVASSRVLDPTSFNLKTNDHVPNLIWASTRTPRNPSKKTSLPPFLSIQGRLLYCSDWLRRTENLYQIVSEQPLSDNDIAKFFKKNGVAREGVGFPDQSCYHLIQKRGPFTEHPALREQRVERYEDAWQDLQDTLYPAFRELSVERYEDAWRDLQESKHIGISDEPIKRYDRWCEENVGCLEDPDVRWIHRQSWDHGLPIVDSNRSASPIELVPRSFYVNGFEGRDGASLTGSILHASRLL